MKPAPKVLHVVENMHRGAVENWLLRMFRFAKQQSEDLNWTFYCTLGQKGKLDEEIHELGGRVVFSPYPLGRTKEFIGALRNHLQKENYDVLHCHHDLVSALYLVAGTKLPITKRIVHVHNADEVVPTGSAAKKAILKPILRGICLRWSDLIVGISDHTLDTFLQGRKRKEGKHVVHYYGVEPAPFKVGKFSRESFRKELNLPSDALLLLFAGRVVHEKNPVYAVDVLAEMRKQNSRVFGIFAGAGVLEDAVKQRAEHLGVAQDCRFLGWRDDVAEVMRCCDWFIHPHVEEAVEGLGLALVEAQLAGLPLLLSLGVPPDPILPGAVWTKTGLKEGPAVWATKALALLRQERFSPEAALAALQKSPFNMAHAWKHLKSLHALAE